MYRNLYCEKKSLHHKFGNFDFDTETKAKRVGRNAYLFRWVKTVHLPNDCPKGINLIMDVICTKRHKINKYDLPGDFTR